jgi:hypothetical protein
VETETSRASPSAQLQLFIEDLTALLPASLCNFRNLLALNIIFVQNPPPLLVKNILRYVPLSSLKELHLALPVTHDFANLLTEETMTPSRSPIKSIMKQLTHLSVAVYDSSGIGGERHFLIPPSPAQTAFPNQEYFDDFF